VLEVDAKRRRIALSMRLDDATGTREARAAGAGDRGRDERPAQGSRPPQGRGGATRRDEPAADGAMADALKRALQRR
jgi:protein Tex